MTFHIWTQEVDIFKRKLKKKLLKKIISIGKNWLNKKITPNMTIPFSSKVKTIINPEMGAQKIEHR